VEAGRACRLEGTSNDQHRDGRPYRQLKPGGALIGTHDLDSRFIGQRLNDYVAAHRLAGFEIEDLATVGTVDRRTMLLENPTAVMLPYQGAEPEPERRLWGHFGTVFTVATKPAGSQL
jgi:hypothetical protein